MRAAATAGLVVLTMTLPARAQQPPPATPAPPRVSPGSNDCVNPTELPDYCDVIKRKLGQSLPASGGVHILEKRIDLTPGSLGNQLRIGNVAKQ